jgi:hypothetical protein
MSLLSVLIVVFIAGGIGGAVNALLSENGFILPKKLPVNGATGAGIWRLR